MEFVERLSFGEKISGKWGKINMPFLNYQVLLHEKRDFNLVILFLLSILLWKSFWRWNCEYSTISVYFLLVVWDERLCSPFRNWTFRYLKRNEKRGDILSWLDASCFCRLYFGTCVSMSICEFLFLYVCVNACICDWIR